MYPDPNRRPRADGSVLGTDDQSRPGSVDVVWVVDTGAAIPVVSRNTADNFIWNAIALSAGRLVTGAVSVTDNLDVTFELDDGSVVQHNGANIGVRGDTIDEHLLGMSVIAARSATLRWNPKQGSGELLP